MKGVLNARFQSRIGAIISMVQPIHSKTFSIEMLRYLCQIALRVCTLVLFSKETYSLIYNVHSVNSPIIATPEVLPIIATPH